MFDDLGSVVKGIASQLGLTFLLGGFLPMLVGVAVNQFVIFVPPYAPGPLNFFPGSSPVLGAYTGEIATTVVLALGLALGVLPLNLFVLRLFEGLLPGVRQALFPLLLGKRRRHQRLYAAIEAARTRRRDLLATYEESGQYEEEADFALQDELHRLHTQREKAAPVQTLPFEARRIAPTGFGNAWAMMEEYPVSRYGMDGMFFWPYLRTILAGHNPALLAQIDNQKLLIDIVLHLALVAGILVIEGIVFAIVRSQVDMVALAAASLAFFWLFYQAAVSYSRSLAGLVAQGYDLYRLHLLDAFGLARPDTLDDEYWVWMRLNAFLRRGEPFYFDMLARRDQARNEARQEADQEGKRQDVTETPPK